GLIIIAVLDKKRVKGSILFGIVVSSLLAWAFAFINPEYAQKLADVLIKTYVSEEKNVMEFVEIIKQKVLGLKDFGIDIGEGSVSL
ncbi:hypothetical protein ACTPEF_24140, partial [Clostridioides difficile]